MPTASRFAVLLCTHNGERFVRAQLDSLLAQSHPPDCVFVHDWGSHDGTRQIVEETQNAVRSVGSWHVVSHPDAPGPGPSFLLAVADCLRSSEEFDYLFFCDQDDVWHRDKLRHFADAVTAHPAVELLYCDVSLIDANGAPLATSYLGAGGVFGRAMDIDHGSSLFVTTVSGMSMAMSRNFLQRSRPLWAAAGWVMHDWAMIIAAHLCHARVVFIAQALVAYRQHGGNLVGGQTSATATTFLAAGAERKAGASRLSVIATLRRARNYVAAVHSQYQRCAALPALPGWRALDPRPGRWAVAYSVLRGHSLPFKRKLKVALGYALFWPNR